MSDEIDDLKAAMTRATPEPDPDRKAETLRLAQEYYARLQDPEEETRHRFTSPLAGLWTGVTTMFSTLTSRGGLAATTALVACGFLFLTPDGRELLRPVGSLLPEGSGASEADETAEIAPVPEAKTTDPAPAARRAVQDDAAPQAATEAAEMADSPPVEAQEAQGGAPEAEAMIAAPPPSPAPVAPLGRAVPEAALRSAPAASAPARVEGGAVAADEAFVPLPEADTEAFANAEDNPVKVASEEPVSTFSIDVDTASWSVVRSSLMRGRMPPAQAVRIEEMVNYFPYDYPAPDTGEAPFRATVGVMETPWNADTQLLHIGLQGTLPAVEDRPPLNLVFLVDTSGSMEDPAKLPLLKQSFRLMLDRLSPQDEVALVAYAGSAGEVLAPTPAAERDTILAALDRLAAGGSTNGQGGLEQAYAVADGMAEAGEVSRVILATDGDFNVGLADPTALEDFIADRRESGTYLSVLGFGRGNLDDATMQALAQNGNGTAAYIDTLSEAQKVLADQLTGALFPIADDVKVQVEFNPAVVAEYRLIGYETRALRREDFNNDAVDAGELGAGHSATALYEVTPVGSPARLTDALRYGAAAPEAPKAGAELGFLRLRYKAPDEETSRLIEVPVAQDAPAGSEARFAAAIAGFGQVLKGSAYLGGWSYGDAIALANGARGEDAFGYRTEAVQMMRLAESLDRE